MESTGTVSTATPISFSRTPEIPAVKPRLQWIDIAKGIAIFLVVLGHTAAGLVNAGILPNTPFLTFLNSWVYAFHVPVFFFIAGMFALRSAERSPSKFIVDKLKVIVYPYIIWTVIQFVIMSLVAGQTNNALGAFTFGSLINALLISPIMEFWYLYALFLIYMLFVGVIALTGNKNLFLGIAIVIFLAGLMVKDQLPWVFASASFSILIFALGVNLNDWVRNRMPLLSTPVLLLGTVIGYGVVTLGIAAGSISAFEPFVLALFGIGATLCLSILLERFTVPFVSAALRLWGEKSLQIYVAHVIAAAGVRIVLSRFLHFDNGLMHLLLGMIAGMYAPIVLDWLCEKIGFHYLFTLRDLPTRKVQPASTASATTT